jgi:hypothetical protein
MRPVGPHQAVMTWALAPSAPRTPGEHVGALRRVPRRRLQGAGGHARRVPAGAVAAGQAQPRPARAWPDATGSEDCPRSWRTCGRAPVVETCIIHPFATRSGWPPAPTTTRSSGASKQSMPRLPTMPRSSPWTNWRRSGVRNIGRCSGCGARVTEFVPFFDYDIEIRKGDLLDECH